MQNLQNYLLRPRLETRYKFTATLAASLTFQVTQLDSRHSPLISPLQPQDCAHAENLSQLTDGEGA